MHQCHGVLGLLSFISIFLDVKLPLTKKMGRKLGIKIKVRKLWAKLALENYILEKVNLKVIFCFLRSFIKICVENAQRLSKIMRKIAFISQN